MRQIKWKKKLQLCVIAEHAAKLPEIIYKVTVLYLLLTGIYFIIIIINLGDNNIFVFFCVLIFFQLVCLRSHLIESFLMTLFTLFLFLFYKKIFWLRILIFLIVGEFRKNLSLRLESIQMFMNMIWINIYF